MGSNVECNGSVQTSVTEMALSSQQQVAKPKVKKSSSAHTHSSGASAKGKNVLDRKPTPFEVEAARQELAKVAGPDIQRPFSSLADACDRLLPYHILAEYDLEDCEEKEGVEPISRSRAWEESLKAQTLEFMTTLEKQVTTYNTIIKKRNEGSMRGEERMMVEQSLLSDEKQKLMNVRAQIEAKDRAEKEAAEAKAKEALEQAERARAEEQARAKAQAQAQADAAARFEAESKAEALRAGADAVSKPENQVKLDTSSSAGQSFGAVNMVVKPGVFADGENEDQDLDEEEEEEGEEVEEVWEEEIEVDDDEDDDDDDDEEDDSDSVDEDL
ncbi:hypothetical protein R1flu_027823 [Riccia fluitans]|uniref:GLTSCR protein conserved domain-containing protein n=1 Tax=Riccia fluitans TaxID=41844 RepID=A0ABD1XKD5_9MARC